MKFHRLCLGCCEDWTWSEDPNESLCPCCKLEREIHRKPKASWSVPVESVDWWGLKIQDVDPDDLKTGYYVASITEGDLPLYRSEQGYH